MAKNRIVIGEEYKKEFECIQSLYKLGVLSSAANVERVSGNEIETVSCIFEFNGRATGVVGDNDGGSELRFEKGGASWFSEIRGKKFNSNTAQWVSLISTVASDYHSNYAIVEFKQDASDRDGSAGRNAGYIAKRLQDTLVEGMFPGCVLGDRLDNDYEDYYAASLCLYISNGGAEPKPILCKLYFRRRRDGRFIPVDRDEAEIIDRNINEKIKNIRSGSASGSRVSSTDGDIANDMVDNLEKAFRRRDCARYLLCTDQYKKELYVMLTRLAVNKEKTLECTGIKVLGISHVQWQNYAYTYTRAGKPVLKLVIGFNNSISLYCINCDVNGVPLIDNNTVMFDDEESAAAYESKFGKTCVISPNDSNLGLSVGEINHIREPRNKATLASHLFQVSCRVNGCSETICGADAVEYSDSLTGDIVRKCRSCPHPEIVYEDIFGGAGERVLTETMFIDEVGCSLTKSETRICASCGRRYVETDEYGSQCKLCKTGFADANGKKLYRKYRGMLSVRMRMRPGKKYCAEDSTVIIFAIGGRKYKFDKLDAKNCGYINSPKKV